MSFSLGRLYRNWRNQRRFGPPRRWPNLITTLGVLLLFAGAVMLAVYVVGQH